MRDTINFDKLKTFIMSCKQRNEKDGVMELNNKEILITRDTTVKDIQFEFTACYPFLKIEFYVPGNTTKINRSLQIDARTLLKQLANANSGRIDISSHR